MTFNLKTAKTNSTMDICILQLTVREMICTFVLKIERPALLLVGSAIILKRYLL